MIIDRTQKDVDLAKKIRAEKVQKFIELTADEISTLERGFITINTLNRIGNKQKEIANLLNSVGIETKVTAKTYVNGDDFTQTDATLLLNNNAKLRNSIAVMQTTPNNPTYLWEYNNVNAIEKILVDLEKLIITIPYMFFHCGATNCGQEQEGLRL